MKVLFLPEIRDYFEELSVILYQKEYFGFYESALQYADELFSDIEINLPNKHKKTAPKYFDRYGKEMYYATFRKNKNTTWYVFFHIYYSQEETIYFVRYMSNNHVIAQYFS
ncbi:MAG: hypothetical protein LUG98_08370 [Tannerellaceae bacterium]|nr:hypothetical protein [Tannerellaceae bacterium]